MTIKIKPSHEGKLTKEVGKKGLTEKALTKEISTAKKKGDVKLEKEEVFAKNAHKWHKNKKPKEIETDRGKFGMK